MILIFSFATIVVDLELLESNIPVEEDGGEVHQAAEGEFGGWRSAMDDTNFEGEELQTQQSTGRAQKSKGYYLLVFSFSFKTLFFSFRDSPFAFVDFILDRGYNRGNFG